jgi:hypothetical protein
MNQTPAAIGGQEGRTSPRIAIISAVTFRGQDLHEAAVSLIGGPIDSTVPTYISPFTMQGPFTLTSPTIYLAHHPITFMYLDAVNPENFSTSVGLKPAGLIHLMPEDVSSVVPLHPNYSNDTEYASLVANGKFKSPTVQTNFTTAPFNFADLPDPVPARAYFDARWSDCWGEQTHCRTITDDSYRPCLIIALSSRVWGTSLFQGSCYFPDLVDPPLALTAIADRTPEEADPLPQLPHAQRDSERVRWNMAASATATVSDAPGAGLLLEPRPTATQPWPLPTTASRNIPGVLSGKSNGTGNSYNDRHGNSYHGAAVFRSSAHALNQRFELQKWLILLPLSIIWVFGMAP